jgi:hypothetical protein
MSYDHTKTQALLKRAHMGSLTKQERVQAKEQISLYYGTQFARLQQNLFNALGMEYTGSLPPAEVNEYIHRYHKQSQEFYIHVNYHHSPSNENLPAWLAEIDREEQGIQVWHPKTKLPHEENQNKEEEEEEEEDSDSLEQEKQL